MRVYRGADVGSYHNLAIATAHLSLAAIKQQKQQPKYDTSKLQENEILVQFNTTIWGRHYALAELDEETDVAEEACRVTLPLPLMQIHQNILAWSLGEVNRKPEYLQRQEIWSQERKQPKQDLHKSIIGWTMKWQERMNGCKQAGRCCKWAGHEKNVPAEERLINKPSQKATQVRDVNRIIIKDEGSCHRRWTVYFETLLYVEMPVEL